MIDKLYKNYEILTAASDKSQHLREFKEILDAVHGSEEEKKLAAQFIAKFFKSFPDLMETALDRQLDLCEDEDVQIRRLAIKELPTFCKDTKENTPKISDILARLLNASDASEVTQVNLSLQALSKYDPLGTAAGLFSQIALGEEQTRVKCLQYVNNKFVKAGSEVFTKEVEELVIKEVKKLLQDVSSDEFQHCMQILSHTKLGKTITGHQELVKLCIEQADLDAELESEAAADDDTLIRYLQCVGEALPYFSSQIETTPFVKFTCETFFSLPTWNLIGAADDQPQTQLCLLKVFAELCTHCGSLEKPKEKVEAIFNVLLEFMPAPPNYIDLTGNPSHQFSHVECLLFAIQALGKQYPEYLTFPDDRSKLKDFRSRLQYLASEAQGYVKKLQEDVKGKNASDPKTEEEKLKIIGLKTTSNIQTLIRDLLQSPPSFKSIVSLSWLEPTAAEVTKKEEKSAKPEAPPAKKLRTNMPSTSRQVTTTNSTAFDAAESSPGKFSKRKVKAAILAIKGKEKGNGKGSWKLMGYAEVFDVAVKMVPEITSEQVHRVFIEAYKYIRADQNKKVKQGKQPQNYTGTEWILKTCVDVSPRAEYQAQCYLKRQALRMCSCGKEIKIKGSKCSACKGKMIELNNMMKEQAKVGWTASYKRQLYEMTYSRILPPEHRKEIEHYINESEDLVGEAMFEIRQKVSVGKAYKVGMGLDREKDYKLHCTSLINSIVWNTQDVNIATFAEIGLAFEMKEAFGEGLNAVQMLGHRYGPKFEEDGSLIQSELYLRYA